MSANTVNTGIVTIEKRSEPSSRPHTSSDALDGQSSKTERNPVRRLAKGTGPVARLIRFFGSVKFGITMMTLILIYASVVSALPQVRGAVEMSEMTIFQHWVFVTLCGLFTVSLILATLTKIRFNLINAGVLTVHLGLLILVGGSVVYFGSKVEGDSLLLSPRLELISNIGGEERVIGDFLAEKDSSWGNFMPAFGGDVKVAVADARFDETGAVTEVLLNAQLGNKTESDLVVRNGGEPFPIGDGRLKVRLNSHGTVNTFYDNETPALYVQPSGGSKRMLAIHGLPQFRERYLDEGYQLQDSEGNASPSKRTWPHVALAGMNIPTGWFEHWRMPIELDSNDLPFDVKVTGFVPYIAGMKNEATGGGPKFNPAITLRLKAGDVERDVSLFGLSPRESFVQLGVPVEFRWVETTAERDEILKELVGPHELYIEVKEPAVTKTIPVFAGQQIDVEGSPYKLTIKNLMPSWPLMTPGFENAASPMASVDVTNGELSYNRTVIQRFPQLSQDIDEKGVRHREGPYDPNLVLRYRSSDSGWMTVIAGENIDPVLAIFDMNGELKTFDLTVGKKSIVTIGRFALDVTMTSYFTHGQRVAVPLIEPLDRRRPNIGRTMSAIRLKLNGKGELADWSETRWCRFSQYPHVEAITTNVSTPDGRDWELTFSRLERALGFDLAARKLSVTFFPGRQNVESWHSDFAVREAGEKDFKPAAVYTNQTFATGNWTLFQSGAAQDHWSYTILGVGNRQGIWPMVLGCVLITIGCLYAFYIKPILKMRRTA